MDFAPSSSEVGISSKSGAQMLANWMLIPLRDEERGKWPWQPLGRVFGIAALFLVATVWASYAQWANFGYRTFDLAYYCQALWQLLHGRFKTTILPVPLLGNHVEPIIFLIVPFFAVFRHPMTFIVVQNAALAAMGPISYDIGKRLGLSCWAAALLAGSLLLTPAAGYIALHEFHPEALAAPLLLLMLRARLLRSLAQHWLWFGAVLACKENMALLLAAYCIVHFLVGAKERPLRAGGVVFLAAAGRGLGWFLICVRLSLRSLMAARLITEAFTVKLALHRPILWSRPLPSHNLLEGPSGSPLAMAILFGGCSCPSSALPLLRPRWLIIASPILLQHLLSWRSSEWTIYFHYAAPLLPLFWMAAAEAVAICDSPTARPIVS